MFTCQLPETVTDRIYENKKKRKRQMSIPWSQANRNGFRRCPDMDCKQLIKFADYSQHRITQHQDVKEERKINCPHCPYWTREKTPKRLEFHISQNHTMNCYWCNYSGVRKEHDEKKCNTEHKTTCGFCLSLIKKGLKEEKEHLEQCQEKWQCIGCKQWIARRERLQHLSTNACKTLLQCTHCSMFLQSSDGLVHMAQTVTHVQVAILSSYLGTTFVNSLSISIPQTVLTIISEYGAFLREHICPKLSVCIGCGHYKTKEEQKKCKHAAQCIHCSSFIPSVEMEEHDKTCPEKEVKLDCKCKVVIKQKEQDQHNCLTYQIQKALAEERKIKDKEITDLKRKILAMAVHIQYLQIHVFTRFENLRKSDCVGRLCQLLDDDFDNSGYLLDDDAFDGFVVDKPSE